MVGSYSTGSASQRGPRQGRDRPGNQRLVVRNDEGEHMPKVEDGPWPAFPGTYGIALALCTQAEGW